MPIFDWHLLWATVGKISLSYILTFPVGWWREREVHAVGIRTFPIVAMASCGYLLIFQIQPSDGVRALDVLTMNSRVLQGLIAGIGFVGGGAIVKDGISVHGTATAASIWNTGAVGAAVAMGRYEVAVVLAILNFITLFGLAPVKSRLDGEPLRFGGEKPKS